MGYRITRGGLRRGWVLACSGALLTISAVSFAYRWQGIAWIQKLLAGFGFFTSCGILAWLLWPVLLRRAQGSIHARSRIRDLGMHAAAAAGFSMTWVLISGAAAYLLRHQPPAPFLRGPAIWAFVWGVLIYGALAQAALMHWRVKERELAAATAELQALRAQLNPHFLFNALHSLTQLAREDPIATQEALERFGDLTRYVLDAGRHGRKWVLLEDELQFTRNYLSIEMLRFGDRLRFIENIDEDALETAVPPLLVQPLVENAVRHGVAPRRGGGTIRLTVRSSTEQLVVEVADDGNGAAADSLDSAHGLGLKSVRRQLRSHFPQAAEPKITTAPNAGFTVRLEIPT